MVITFKKILKDKSDESLIMMLKEIKCENADVEDLRECSCKECLKKNIVFEFLINRHYDENGIVKPSWKSKAIAASKGFLKKSPYMVSACDYEYLCNSIFESLYKSVPKYNTDRPFSAYFNGLIFKTLMNARRNFSVKQKHYIFGEGKPQVVFSKDERLDDLVSMDDSDLSKHEAIPSEYNLEKDTEKKELLTLVWKKCRKYLSDVAFDILIHNDMTQHMTNGDLALKYGCSSAKISSIKKRQIIPAVNTIKRELAEELGTDGILECLNR